MIIIVAFLFPEGKALKYTYQINDVTREPIIAPFTYSIQKSKEKLQDLVQHLLQHYLLTENGLFMEQDMRTKLH